MKILSIDFDYFVIVSKSFRQNHFPDGGAEYGDGLNAAVWETLYGAGKAYGEPVETVQADTESLAKVRTCILNQGKQLSRCMIADSHVHAYNFIKGLLPEGDKATIYNIDFHHDTYNNAHNKSEVNCGNWQRRLHEECMADLYWVNRKGSELEESLATQVSLDDALAQQYDALFVCRSGWWTPPHLDDVFIEQLVHPIIYGGLNLTVQYEQGIDKSRYTDDFKSDADKYSDMLLALRANQHNK